MADFVPKKSRLAIGGQGGPKWLANVEQMVVLNGIHAGGLPWAQNLSEKCTQWCQNGSKMAHFGPKCQFWPKCHCWPLETPNGAHKSNKWWYSMEYMQENINKNQQLETAGESSVSTHYAYFSLRLFLILVMHIFLSMHLCMRGEKMANMMSA